jgi:hypothetical protein
MAPTCQEETNQKIHIDITTLLTQLNRDILAIHAKNDHIQDHLNSQIVEVHSSLNKFMNKLHGPSSSNLPLYTKGVDSNHPLHSHSNSLPCEPCIPKFEVNKFDRSDPQSWVTQMEHYFSLHGIIDELTKICYGIIYMDLEIWKWWKWCCNALQGYVAWCWKQAKSERKVILGRKACMRKAKTGWKSTTRACMEDLTTLGLGFL